MLLKSYLENKGEENSRMFEARWIGNVLREVGKPDHATTLPAWSRWEKLAGNFNSRSGS